MIKIVMVQRGGKINIPKDFLLKHGYKVGDKVVLKCTEQGIMLCKSNAFNEIDIFFESMDSDLRKLWGIKVEQLHKKD